MKIIYGSDNYFQAKFYDEYANALSNKYVQFNVNGTNYPVQTNDDGIAILNIKLNEGLYNITSSSLLDESRSNLLLVFHTIQAKNMTIEYNSDYTFKATFLDEKSKPLSKTGVIFILDDEIQPMVYTDNNGQATLNKTLSMGTHKITSVNTITNEKIINNIAVVENLNSIITLNNVNNINYGQNAIISGNIGLNFLNAILKIQLISENGFYQEFVQQASNQFNIELKNLNAGKYNVHVNYLDDVNLINIDLNKTFAVFKIDPMVNIHIEDIYTDGLATIEIKVANSNGTLRLKVGSKTYYEQLKNGDLIKNIDGLTIGDYDVEILFEGDNNYNPIIKLASFKMYHFLNFDVNFSSNIILPDDMHYKDEFWDKGNYKIYISNFINDKNDVLELLIDNKPVTILKQDDYGGDLNEYYILEFNPSFLNEGIHSWEIKYSNVPNYIIGNKVGSFYYSINSHNIDNSKNNVVKKSEIKKIVLTLKSIKIKKSTKKVQLYSTLKINGKNAINKKITFKFNGKKFKLKTNKKGVAKLIIKKNLFKNIKIGKKIKYQVAYDNIIVKKTVKMKK